MKTILRFGIVVVLIWLIAAPIQANDKVNKIEKLMAQYHDYGQFNGTILVAENGKVIFKKGYGYANMDWDIPNMPDTKFRIGSITKQFTSMLIMQLVEDGKIKLDGKLTDYIPEYRHDTGDNVTIHHLLTHTSGIPSYTNIPGVWTDSSKIHYEMDYMIKHLHSGDLEFDTGSEYKYNNTGYYLLASIIEKVSGESFENNLVERILKPLKMENSGVERNERILKNKADGFLKRGKQLVNDPYFYLPNALGAGDMYSTVEDMYLWDRALYTDKLLSKKYIKKMFTPYLEDYAYGWVINKMQLGEQADSVNLVWHNGGINGFNTGFFRIIDDEHTIIVFNNTGGIDEYGICQAITNILYNMSYDMPKLSITETIGDIILKSDIKTGIETYNDLKTNKKNEYNFSEAQLNNLGYQLLGMDRNEDAIEIFKLNIEMYPEAFNPYDSLGEAYMIDGQTELAIQNYAKSLEFNPKNTGAIIMLGKIINSK